MNISTAVRQFKNTDRYRKVVIASDKAFRPLIKVGHKHGPAILIGAGLVGGVATVVLAAKATLKLEETLDETKANVDRIEKNEIVEGYTAEMIAKDKTKARVVGAFKVVKLYVPALSIGAASVGCILGAYGIMAKRQVAMVAAYNALEKTFEVYRKRVVEEIGEEKEADIRHGIREEKVQDDNGKNKTVAAIDVNGLSQYARFFDEGSPEWEPEPTYNFAFLKAQQSYWSDRLTSRGHVFLNEVYDALGLERSPAGAVVGWVLGPDNDNYVDFGMFSDTGNERKRSFVNGLERNILLDFNVDGVILDKI